jgi:uncharacterized cupredoxin-like copper-binding protein
VTVLVIAVAAALCAAGCNQSPAPERGGTVVHVTEKDFRISRPKPVPAGDIVFQVRNRGPDDHELIVVKEEAEELPSRADGLTVDEDAAESRIVGALEPGKPGTRQLRVRLAPGHYELFCNMFGHYHAGMESELVVR